MIRDGARISGLPGSGRRRILARAIAMAALAGSPAPAGDRPIAGPPGAVEIPSRTIHPPTGRILSTALSPDGSRLAVGSEEGGLWIRETGSGGLVRTLHEDRPPERPGQPSPLPEEVPGDRRFETEYGPVQALAFAPGGTRLAAAIPGGSDAPGDDEPRCVIHVWDVKTGRQIAALSTPTVAVRALAFEPAGGRLCSIDVNHRLATWEVETGRKTSEFGAEDPPGLIESPARKETVFGHGSKRAVSLMLDDRGEGRPPSATLKLWDRAAASLRGVDLMLGEGGPTPTAAALGPDGLRVAVASTDGMVRLLAFGADRLGPGLPVRDRFGLVSLAFSPGGERLLAVDDDGSATVCGLPRGRILHTFRTKPGLVRSLAWYDDRILAVVGGWELIPSRVPSTPPTVEPLSIWSIPIAGP